MEINGGVLETKNNQQYQQFKTLDALSIILSFLIVCGLTYLVFKKNIEDKKLTQAHMDVENLAQELILKPVNSSFYTNERLPASEAPSLGLDPWGRDYLTRVVKNAYGQPIYLVVLSAGPDQELQTQVEDTLSHAESLMENLKFSGDDIGFIKAYR